MRLNLQGVTVRFGNRVVLDELDLDVSGPALVSLMGPSGAGKTTALSVVAGHTVADSGSVTFEGASPGDVEWIIQTAPLLPRRSALDNVALGPLSRGETVEVARDLAMRSIEAIGLGPLAEQACFRLSGGERQRVAIARVLSTAPRMVLADEPTASLDALSRERVCDALRQVAQRGLVLVATHDDYVASRCDLVYRIENGKAVQR